MRQITLPNRTGNGAVETLSLVDNLVIIGANGTGKSRLGQFIEQNTPDTKSKRISAQRMLSFADYAPMMSYEQSITNYKNTYRNRPVIEIQNDYESVLSVVFSKTAKRDSDYVKLCQENGSAEKPPIPESAVEKLIRIWNDILPHRKITLHDNKITVKAPNGQEYSGREMSDGERVALYLISQCLVVPEGYTLVIDEPELHLHKALMSRLWNKIEEERNDCIFVYITHDLDFASSRVKATKLWVKQYLQGQWTWDLVPDSIEIPENLLLEIIGSRKPILFLEGEKGSYDHAIYQHFYSGYTIIPRGSGNTVIESTKGVQSNANLHSIQANGLIDRDYRNEDEIKFLGEKGISIIDVAEVENILLTPSIIKLIATHQALDPDKVLNDITEFIISSLNEHLEKEVSYKTSLEVNFKLNALDNKQKGVENIKNAISQLVASIDVEKIYTNNLNLYKDILQKKDLKLALKYYTNKGLLPSVSKFFNLHGNGYADLILRLIKTDKSKEIIDALKEYLPEIKPIVKPELAQA